MHLQKISEEFYDSVSMLRLTEKCFECLVFVSL